MELPINCEALVPSPHLGMKTLVDILNWKWDCPDTRNTPSDERLLAHTYICMHIHGEARITKKKMIEGFKGGRKAPRPAIQFSLRAYVLCYKYWLPFWRFHECLSCALLPFTSPPLLCALLSPLFPILATHSFLSTCMSFLFGFVCGTRSHTVPFKRLKLST